MAINSIKLSCLLQIREIVFQEVVKDIEVYAGPLIHVEKSVLVDITREPETLFDRGSDLAKQTENGEFVRRFALL